LVDGKDSLLPAAAFDDPIKRKLRIPYKWKEDRSYALIIPDSVFFTAHGLTNDSAVVQFRTRQTRDFGSLKVDIALPKKGTHYIIQLLDEKDNVLKERYLSESGKELFEYLTPGNYRLKAIKDKNNNHRWDTGNYELHIQPEDVIFYPTVIEVRGNWDVDESWSL